MNRINFITKDKNGMILVCKENEILLSDDEGKSWKVYWVFKNSYPIRLFVDNENCYFVVLRGPSKYEKEQDRFYKILKNSLVEIKLDYGTDNKYGRYNLSLIHDIFFDKKNNIYLSMVLFTMSLAANYMGHPELMW